MAPSELSILPAIHALFTVPANSRMLGAEIPLEPKLLSMDLPPTQRPFIYSAANTHVAFRNCIGSRLTSNVAATPPQGPLVTDYRERPYHSLESRFRVECGGLWTLQLKFVHLSWSFKN